MNGDINDYLPSILNPRCIKKQDGYLSLTQNSIVSRRSLSLRKNNVLTPFKPPKKINPRNKENFRNVENETFESLPVVTKSAVIRNAESVDVDSLGFSVIKDLLNTSIIATSSSLGYNLIKENSEEDQKSMKSIIAISSATELNDKNSTSDATITYNAYPTISVSFGVNNCESIKVSSNNSAIKRIFVSHKQNNTNVECELVENSKLSTENQLENDLDENMNKEPSTLKRHAVAVNLEIKKQKLTNLEEAAENSKVLILNSDAIENISHVIVQPPNYKLVKRKVFVKSKFESSYKNNAVIRSGIYNENGNVGGVKLRQKSIDSFFRKNPNVSNLLTVSKARTVNSVHDSQVDNVVRDEKVMSRNSGVADAVKCERVERILYKVNRKENNESTKLARVSSTKRDNTSPRSQDIKTSSSDAPRVPSPRRVKNDSTSSHSPRKNVESIQFCLPTKSKSNRTSLSPRNIPHHKIVAGTHFAVDAFSYGDIPNVKHYFLTHFHSDHYAGLKKHFNKLLFCSKITADLCVSRLGVSPKYIHVINVDESVRVEGTEVTAVEANHCPGAIMLVFTLPNGKTLLHTGDFRASPIMESYPIFWNKDIHTIYLDTTYCNPRYDFPTQDQSLEMAQYILRQKKMALEKAGKKFSTVLIVCGTYTIGKEKFFLGMAQRAGCTVWACPEKDRVLQTVEGRSFSHAPPTSCQLHVVPMRDLTHEKLRSYMDSLQGSFTEVVAFKPSGWENGKNSSVEKDMVTIHGIPYSEHSSFSEIIRFVKFLEPKQVVPTVDISGGVKAVQKYFPCPLVYKEEIHCQSKLTDYFGAHNRQQVPAVT